MQNVSELPSVEKGLFINNKFVNSVSGETIAVENPATGKEIAQIQRA